MADLFPDSTPTALSGLDQASDLEVWNFAQDHGCTIVTKDSDFSDLSVFQGFPPKVIILRIGNCTTAQLENALRSNVAAIAAFIADPLAGLLEIA